VIEFGFFLRRLLAAALMKGCANTARGQMNPVSAAAAGRLAILICHPVGGILLRAATENVAQYEIIPARKVGHTARVRVHGIIELIDEIFGKDFIKVNVVDLFFIQIGRYGVQTLDPNRPTEPNRRDHQRETRREKRARRLGTHFTKTTKTRHVLLPKPAVKPAQTAAAAYYVDYSSSGLVGQLVGRRQPTTQNRQTKKSNQRGCVNNSISAGLQSIGKTRPAVTLPQAINLAIPRVEAPKIHFSALERVLFGILQHEYPNRMRESSSSSIADLWLPNKSFQWLPSLLTTF
jgi:hypothetical protein